ncbi:MAG: UDP-3-O-acyl-N-acetylglucosamine deacetylase, partial [Gammaproteobacteria bacterium]
MTAQKTIARAAEFSGIALHGGGAARARLSPLGEDEGIVFVRGGKRVRAAAENVGDTRLATMLGDGTFSVGTVEHLLSALSALCIDNLQVEVDAAELPILDGSAAPWMLFLTDACGIAEQSKPRRVMRAKKEITAELNGGSARLSPAANGAARYAVSIDFPHAAVRRTGLHFSHELSADSYEKEISRARTFCYVKDVNLMRKNRRALGGSLNNAVVYDDLGVLNAEGLRYPDEFARHKVLDAIGDCYINGHLILANYESRRPGHA